MFSTREKLICLGRTVYPGITGESNPLSTQGNAARHLVTIIEEYAEGTISLYNPITTSHKMALYLLEQTVRNGCSESTLSSVVDLAADS